jgi:hypothetical protein
MPQISSVGTGGDYTTLAAWEAAEGGSDYGVGNPAIAEVTGTIANENISGVFIRGFIIRAAAGEEPAFRGGSGTAVLTGGLQVNITTAGTVALWKDIEITGNVTTISGDASVDHDFEGVRLTATTAVSLEAANRTTNARFCLVESPARGFDADTGVTTATALNCTVIDPAAGNFAYVRWHVTNCLKLGTGTGFVQSVTGSNYNASSDTSAPGANSLQNRTTADVVNFAGGDFRTASGSALSTAGDGGTFIGAALEAGGGVTVTPSAGSQAYTGQAPVVLTPNPVAVTPTAGSQAYTGQAPTVITGASVVVLPPTGSQSYSGQAPLVLVPRTVQPTTGSQAYTGQQPAVTVGNAQVSQPSTGVQTYAGQSPTVVTGNNVFTFPSTGTQSYTGQAPTVVAGAAATVLPSTGTVVYATFAPIVRTGDIIAPPAIRTRVIGAESRTRVIGAESRTSAIGAETRIRLTG